MFKPLLIVIFLMVAGWAFAHIIEFGVTNWKPFVHAMKYGWI